MANFRVSAGLLTISSFSSRTLKSAKDRECVVSNGINGAALHWGGGRGLVLRGSIYTWVYIILLIDQEILTVLLEDEEGAGEDLQQLGRHHGGRRQVAGAVALQGAGVAHGEHEGGGLQHQHPQRQILQPYMV